MKLKNRYPQFDTLEIILEREFQGKNYKPVSPIKTGNRAPDFSLSKDFGRWAQFTSGAETRGPVLYNKFISKPLVIAFYSDAWAHRGVEHLLKLNAIHHEVKALGGNLLVISPERLESLNKLVWDHNLSLNFYFDLQNEVSASFGLYDEHNPIWNRFSGIDENVPLLATYVLNNRKQLLYHHIDWDFTSTFSSEGVLSAVYDAGLFQNNLRSA